VTDQDDPAPPDKRELLEAFDQVVDRERERAVERGSLPMRRRTHLLVAALCVLAWGALAYTWIGKPAWLFPTDPAANLSPAELDRQLRFGLYLSRERVLDYWVEHRRLPATLAEAGDVEAGVEYTISGDSTFVVSVLIRDSLLTLNESQPADDLLKPTGISPGRAR
jgi:hypothetical protein